MLQDISSNQEGLYTCELHNAEETLITNTFLRIDEGQGRSAETPNVCEQELLNINILYVWT